MLILGEHQKIATEYILREGRCELVMGTGMGKTITTLNTLNVLSIFSSKAFPVLIVAPINVAKTTWVNELAKWDEFNRFKVSLIVGDARKREEAIKAKADIYIINYDNLTWLFSITDKRFGTVVCDESTKIKHHSVFYSSRYKKLIKKGTANASELVYRANKTTYWINLSATPVPNGHADLWGQMFPIDFGARLGITKGDFYDRWYIEGRFHQQIIRGEEAMREIEEAVSDKMLILTPEKYFDLGGTIKENIEIRLPGAMQKQYKQLEINDFLHLNEYEIAQNAGNMKCRQYASGCIITDEGEFVEVHDYKIKALNELRERLPGKNLLVAYYFKADEYMLRKHFPEGVFLNDNPTKNIDDWNAGKIPMLMIHSQSAAHGLNLQYGGHHLCIYTMDWNAENYEQVIERIGATRQKQAGFDRDVFVYVLSVLNTVDANINYRVENKIRVSNSLKDFLFLKNSPNRI